jgi:hypothetical protein
MNKDKKKYFAQIIADLPKMRVVDNLEDILLHDADVDQYDNTMRIRMASLIDTILNDFNIKDKEVSDELKDWQSALRDLESGARGFDEAAELSRRAGL